MSRTFHARRRGLVCVVASAALLGLALAAGPAAANCAGSRPFAGSYVFTPGYGEDPIPDYPGYYYGPSVSTSLVGAFWALGSGQPAVGAGIDNGGYAALGGWLYEYGGYPAFINGNWRDGALIDGCIDDGANPDCMVLLLNDRNADDAGFFATISALRQGIAGFDFFQPGLVNLRLAPIPSPSIAGQTLTDPTTLELTIDAPDVTAGLFLDDACATDVVAGYRLYRFDVAPGSPAPIDRDRSAWTAVPGTFGPGDPAVVAIDCSLDGDLFLATSIVFDSGFETTFLSSNSVRITCSPTCSGIDADGDGACAEDCDDGDPTVYPGAPETCDGIANDCDDPSWPAIPPGEQDDDGDGFAACVDCDDLDGTVRPGAVQQCDGVNNDCDDPSWPAIPPGEQDDDGDGFPACADCDDGDAATFPAAAQACDGLNNDCDDPSWPALAGTNESDDDGDGLSECAGDCDDGSSAVFPGAAQTCDGLNNDCLDPGWPELPADELDADGDGFGTCAGDCDDDDPSSFPGAADPPDFDDDGIQDGCDPYPFWSLIVRATTTSVVLSGGTIDVTFEIFDQFGNRREVDDVRLTVSADGAAVWPGPASVGTLLDGAGTSEARIELVAGRAVLPLTSPLPETVRIGGFDSEQIGLRVQQDIEESFADDDGGFRGETPWERGVPTTGPDPGPQSPIVWATDLDGPYDDGVFAQLRAPAFIHEPGQPLELELRRAFFRDSAGDDRARIRVDGDNSLVWDFVTPSAAYAIQTFDLSDVPYDSYRLYVEMISDFDGRTDLGLYISDIAIRGLSTTIPFLDPAGDEDGDGATNGEELALGLDPYDTDTDDDGAPDGPDNCPTLPNPSQHDLDGDGVGDLCDDDDDGDGVDDAVDSCPVDPDPAQTDTDGDLIGDVCDLCPTLFDDPPASLETLAAALAAEPYRLSSLIPGLRPFGGGESGTSITSAQDPAYGIGNILETELATSIPYTSGVVLDGSSSFGAGSRYVTVKLPELFVLAVDRPANDEFRILGTIDSNSGAALDGSDLLSADGRSALFVKRWFNTPAAINHVVVVGAGLPATQAFPTNQQDAQGIVGFEGTERLYYLLFIEEVGNRIDDERMLAIVDGLLELAGPADGDGDGVGNRCDICPDVFDPSQDPTDTDQDSLPDSCDVCPTDPANDGDGDGVCDDVDGCPSVADPGQLDGDGDGVGDACQDGDGDGVIDRLDSCPELANADQLDTDEDGLGDACDALPDVGLGVRIEAPAFTLPGRPVEVTYTLVYGDGSIADDLAGIRILATAGGVGQFADGNDEVLIEFVDGVATLELDAATPGTSEPRGIDVDGLGVLISRDLLETFDDGPGGFVETEPGGDWEWGAATSSGSPAWVTDLDSNSSATSRLVSPWFMMPARRPTLSFSSSRQGGTASVSSQLRGEPWRFVGVFIPDDDAVEEISDPFTEDGYRWIRFRFNAVTEADPGWLIDDVGLSGAASVEFLEPGGDLDGDGLTNADEFDLGTTPDDPDTDSDGVPDGSDNCPLDLNPSQIDVVHPNGIGDDCDDPDGDGVADRFDNCPDTPNPSQSDVVHPGNGGDACDDPDLDGIPDSEDNCPDLATTDQSDPDGDGDGTPCDSCPNVANPDQTEDTACFAGVATVETCLSTAAELIEPTSDGQLVVLDRDSQTPDRLVFEFFAPNCGTETDTLTFSLNGAAIAAVDLDGGSSCSNVTTVGSAVADDAALIASLWLEGLDNTIGVAKPGDESAVVWARVRFENETRSQEFCLRTTPGSACDDDYVLLFDSGGPFGSPSAVNFGPVAFDRVLVRPFTQPRVAEVIDIDAGTPLPSIDLDGLAPGAGRVCLRRAVDPYFLAIDSSSVLSRLDPATGTREAIGFVPSVTFGIDYDNLTGRATLLHQPFGEFGGPTTIQQVRVSDAALVGQARIPVRQPVAVESTEDGTFALLEDRPFFGPVIDSYFVRIDPESGGSSTVAPFPSIETRGLAFDPQAQTWFTTAYPSPALFGSGISELDPSAGTLETIGINVLTGDLEVGPQRTLRAVLNQFFFLGWALDTLDPIPSQLSFGLRGFALVDHEADCFDFEIDGQTDLVFNDTPCPPRAQLADAETALLPPRRARTATRTIVVSNIGGGELSYDATSTAPWLTVLDGGSGTIPTGESRTIEVELDSSALDAGSYTGIVEVATDSPREPLLEGRVSLEVGEIEADRLVLDVPRGTHRASTPTAIIQLPAGYDPGDVVIATVGIGDEVFAETSPVQIGDADGDGVPELRVFFDGDTLRDAFGDRTDLTFTVAGEIEGQTWFFGTVDLRTLPQPPIYPRRMRAAPSSRGEIRELGRRE